MDTKKIFKALLSAGLIIQVFLFAAPAFAQTGCSAQDIRWASSSGRVYITGSGTSCTLSDIKTYGSKYIPLVSVSPSVWFLGANIILQNGATLLLQNEELRLKSDSSGFVSITAKWGNVKIENEKITSWDQSNQRPDTNYSDGRAYISVKSFLESSGAARESRMDIANSDISNLGFYKAESYGLSWKVLGGSGNSSFYDKVNVYGNVTGSKIGKNFFGIYTFGGQNMNISGNEVYDSIWYGIDPHDDSDYLMIISNNAHDNGIHGIIASQRCNNTIIQNNTSSNNGGVGIMLHRNATNSTVSGNTCNGNDDSGIAIFDSRNNVITNNVAKYNVKGIRLSVGSSSNAIAGNNFSNNTQAGVYTYKGTDTPTVGTGRIILNTFKNNTISSNGYGLKLKQADRNTFSQNNIKNNQIGICLTDSYSNVFNGNILSGNGGNYCNN